MTAFEVYATEVHCSTARIYDIHCARICHSSVNTAVTLVLYYDSSVITITAVNELRKGKRRRSLRVSDLSQVALLHFSLMCRRL